MIIIVDCLMKRISDNLTLVIGFAILLIDLSISFYLFYQKRVLGTQVFGTDLIPGTPPFVIYTLDLLTIVVIFVFALVFIKLLLYAAAKVNSERSLKVRLEERQELLSIASHELSSPLTNIKGTLSVLSPQVGVEYRKFADRAMISVEELIKLITDLLTVSRFEMGKIKVAPQPTQVEDIIKEVVNQYKMESARKGANLTYDKVHITDNTGQMTNSSHMSSVIGHMSQEPSVIGHMSKAAPLPLVLADGEKIREVLNNFVSNAIKYGIPQSSGEDNLKFTIHNLKSNPNDSILNVSNIKNSANSNSFQSSNFKVQINDSVPQIVVSATQKGKEVIVSVSDHGIGIKPTEIASLFNRFVRLPATAGVRSGSGLGLYISRLITEAHKGRIWVESPPPGGATGSVFYFSLPIAV